MPGYPKYPPSEDIYQRFKKEGDVDPDEITRKKAPNEREEQPNELHFSDDVSGSDLDEEQEATGNEDDEYNFYSLGAEKDQALRNV